jgi:lipopolysaccharide export system protein LptC
MSQHPSRRRRRRINWSGLTLLVSACASLAIVGYLGLYWDSNPPASLMPYRSDKERVDLYAEQVHGTKYDVSGREVQNFRAVSMQHYQPSNHTKLITPIVESSGRDGKIWDTTAVEGTLIGDDEILLQGDVAIRDRERTMQLRTETLRYFPDRGEAATEVAVILRKDNDTTRAVGMRADLNNNRVELLHQVESIHVQPL